MNCVTIVPLIEIPFLSEPSEMKKKLDEVWVKNSKVTLTKGCSALNLKREAI
jgi:hypothetical protein